MSGVEGARKRDFSAAELALLEQNASTAVAMNVARRETRYSDRDLALRGDDIPFEHQREQVLGHVTLTEKIELAVHGQVSALELAEAFGAHGRLLAAAAPWTAVATAVVGVAGGLKMLAEKNEDGRTLNATAIKNEMHVAMLSALDIPAKFKEEQIGKFTVSGKSFGSGAQKMVATLATEKNKPIVALLQLHADQGMNAARDMVDAGITDKQAHFDRHPDLRARYDADAAFKAGFDAVVWAKSQRGDEYKDLVRGLESRDARYEQHHIAWRA